MLLLYNKHSKQVSLQVSTYMVSPPVLATSYTLYFFEAVLQLAGMACCNSPPVGKKHPGDLSFKGNEQVFALGHCCCIRHTHTHRLFSTLPAYSDQFEDTQGKQNQRIDLARCCDIRTSFLLQNMLREHWTSYIQHHFIFSRLCALLSYCPCGRNGI